MKKSKILMPLTGIAAVGAIAPVVAMTSCGNKNTYELIKSVEVTQYLDGGLIGADTLQAAATAKTITVPVLATLAKDVSETSHTFVTYWNSKKGNMFSIAEGTETPIDPSGLIDKQLYAGAFELSVDADKVAAFLEAGKTEDKTEVFEWIVTYEERDKTQVVGKQEVKYSITAHSKKKQCPKLSADGSTAIHGTCTKDVALAGTEFALSGLTFGEIPAGNVKVRLGNTDLTLTEQTTNIELHIVNSKDVQAEAGGAIHFNGKLEKVPAEVVTGTAHVFAILDDIVINFSDDSSTYVKANWSETISLEVLKAANWDKVEITIQAA